MRTQQEASGLSEDDWQELVDTTDALIDQLNDTRPTIALAALGNVVCSVWECHGDQLPHSVMLDWLNQVYLQTKRMHKPHTKH